MSHFLKTAFQPLSNRYYTGKKLSALNYTFGYLPGAVICLLAGIFVERGFLLILPILVIIGVVDYVLFDGIKDKIMWKLFWHNFYEEKHFENSHEHNAMKAFERNPTEANQKAVEDHIFNQKQ